MAFHDHTENGITVLQSDLLCGSIRHGFSTRTGGVSPRPVEQPESGRGPGRRSGQCAGELPPAVRRAGSVPSAGGAQ